MIKMKNKADDLKTEYSFYAEQISRKTEIINQINELCNKLKNEQKKSTRY